MKKVFGVSLLALMLMCLCCASALAQTTGIAMDGKVYTFTGGEETYQADGKTFIIGAESVVVQEPGLPDRVLELFQTEGTEIMRDGHPAAAGQETDDSTVICEGSAAYEAAEAIAVYTHSYSYPENDEAWARRFERYAEYGLSCDPESRTLMVQGQRVRSFTDAYPVSGGVCTIIEFTDEQGTIDLRTERDQTRLIHHADGSLSPEGLLIGIRVLTEEESAERSKGERMPQMTATSEGEMTAAEKQAFFAPYAAFGLCYDAASDEMIFRGQRVRRFLDIRQSNGEPLDSGRFHGSMTSIVCCDDDQGEVDVEVIRDYTKPDANGDGALIGMMAERVR